MNGKVQLKVCGVTRRADLEACVDLGVHAVGLNFWSGSKRCVGREAALAMLEGLDRKSTAVVGVFVDSEPAWVSALVDELALDAVQPHGERAGSDYAECGASPAPWVRVIRGTPPLDTLRNVGPAPAWTLLDSAVAGFGGRGQTTDWRWAANAVAHLAPHPVWLAGGLGPANASQAIRTVRPAGLDVASGVELPDAPAGEKDAAAIAALLRICQNQRP